MPSSLKAFYDHASVKAAYAIAQSVATIHLTAVEMMAGELEDYHMYEYNGLEFFPAYNQLWNPSGDGRFCRVVLQSHEGEPRWVVNHKLVAAGGDS
jgi:hypothetical protein